MADAADGAAPPAPRPPHAAILRELRDRFGPEPAGRAVEIYLAARGYDPGQIAAVLAELASGAPGAEAESADDPTADDPAADDVERPASAAPLIRVWAPHERARFTPEAWGRLLQLRAAGMGDHEFEHLVDRALLQLDGPVTPAELRALLGDALGPGETDSATVH